MMEVDPTLKDVLCTNLMLFNQANKFDGLVSDWTQLFQTCLNDLLRTKGVVAYSDTKSDISKISKLLEEGADGKGRDYDLSFVSLVKR